MRKVGYVLGIVLVLGFVALPLLGGCRMKTDLREMGAAVGAGWDKGPRIGVDASAGKHEVAIDPLSGGAGAAEGVPAPVEPDAPARDRFSRP